MFTLNREALLVELSLLASAAEKKGTIPALAFTLFEIANGKAKLTATDLDLFLTTQIDAEGDPWTGCAPFRQVHDFVKLLDKSVECVSFTPKETRIEVKAPKSKMTLPILAADSFPQPEKTTTQAIPLDGEWFIPALKRVISSAPDDSSAMNLAGVYIECGKGTIALAATDRHRLSVAKIPLEREPFTLFLPRVGVLALAKLEPSELTLAFNENVACFSSGDRVLTTRLLVGQFPDWRMVVPKEFKYSVRAQTKDIQNAIRRASATLDRHRVTGGDARDSIRLRFSREAINVETQESDRGYSEETVEAKSNMNGDSVLMGFNVGYISDALNSVGDEVEISLNDELSQVKVRPLNSESVLHIVMPCRI